MGGGVPAAIKRRLSLAAGLGGVPGWSRSSPEKVSLERGGRGRAREVIKKDAAGGTALCRRSVEAPTLPWD